MFKIIRRWLTNNLWVKLIALFLAIISWFYINEEVEEAGTTIRMPTFLSRFIGKDPVIAKNIKIQPNIQGNLPRGYEIQHDRMSLDPSKCKVWGRKSTLDDVRGILTVPIDVRKKTQTFVTNTRLESIPGVVLPEDKIIEVKIPIVKQEQD